MMANRDEGRVHDGERPIGARRANYDVWGRQDWFMSSLLRDQIGLALRTYAAPAPSGARALDVGCGAQPFRPALESLGYTYTGLDAVQNPDGAVDIVCAIDETLPQALIDRGPFQFMLCTEVLEHVADWNAAFANLAGLLADGGYLFVTCPFFYPLHEEPYDFWRPTVHALRFYADRVGLQTTAIEGVGDAWDVLGTLSASCGWSPVRPGIFSRAMERLVSFGMRCVFTTLRRHWPQRLVNAHSKLYLANIAVFQKPSH